MVSVGFPSHWFYSFYLEDKKKEYYFEVFLKERCLQCYSIMIKIRVDSWRILLASFETQLSAIIIIIIPVRVNTSYYLLSILFLAWKNSSLYFTNKVLNALIDAICWLETIRVGLIVKFWDVFGDLCSTLV